MRIALRIGLLLGAAALLPRPAAAADGPSNEDLRHIRALAVPALSPDGKQVVFSVIESTAEGGRSHLWLTEIGGKPGSARQITNTPSGADADTTVPDPHGETDPAWLPSGNGILFLAKRDKQRQLFRLPLPSGEAVAYLLTLPPDQSAADVSGFAVAPDGKTIALLAHEPETADEKKKHDGKDDAVWVDHEKHRARLILIDLDAAGNVVGAPHPAPIVADVDEVAWSPASDRLVALTEAPNNAAAEAPQRKAWLISRNDPEHPSQITQLPTTISHAAWSRDATSLAFHAQAAEDAPPGFDDLYVYSFASHETRNLSTGFSGAIGGGAPIFAETGASIVQTVDVGVKTAIARFDPAAGKPTLISPSEPVIDALATNVAQTGFVYLGSGSTTPKRLFIASSLNGPAQLLDAPATETVAIARPASKLVQWQNDGLTVDGLLYLPAAAAEGHKVPLILDIHGGPMGAWQDASSPITALLVGHGWAVLRPNPRGSIGYGAHFAAANKNDLGGGDFRDIMAGLDAVLKQYPIDPGRLALMGYSYGGEMAGFAEGKTDRFKVIISGAPVIDQNSEYGTESNEAWYDRWYFGKPWENHEDAWRQSPLAGVTKAKTPFLLLQGESDTTDPAGQSHEMYRALRESGVPADLVLYPRESHGTLSEAIHGYPTTEPWHGLDARKHIIDALDQAFTGS